MTDVELMLRALIECVGQQRFERALERVKAGPAAAGQSLPDRDPQKMIDQILKELNIPPNLLGRTCMIACVELLMEREGCHPAREMTKTIYPEAARRCGTTPCPAGEKHPQCHRSGVGPVRSKNPGSAFRQLRAASLQCGVPDPGGAGGQAQAGAGVNT